jgi:predicted PP-loop superfamily ATPase
MGNCKITTADVAVHTTTDGEQFDRLHKAEAHQAELDIRQLVAESGDYDSATLDTIMEACRIALIYVPPQLWEDMRK